MKSPTRWPPHQEKRVLRLLAVLCLAGAVARGVVVFLSTGSDDMFTWYRFALRIGFDGLIETYRNVRGFNHPPLMGLYARAMRELSDVTGIYYPYIFKIGPVAADFGVAALLWRTWRARGRSAVGAAAVVCAYLWSPVAILVAAHHGNTDSMLAMAMLAAALTAAGGRAPFVAGLVLGAAINVKIVAVFLIPPLWAQQHGRRGVIRYGAGLAVAALPFVPVLLLVGKEFYRNAIAYNSNLEHWGVELLLLQATQVRHLAGLATSAVAVYAGAGRWIILAVAFALAALGRRGERLGAVDAAAVTMAGFLILTPGYGVQYAVWVVPLLFAAAPRTALAYSAVCGAFLFLVYLDFWTGGFPAVSAFFGRYAMAASIVGFGAWLVLIGFVRATVGAALRRPARSRDPVPERPSPVPLPAGPAEADPPSVGVSATERGSAQEPAPARMGPAEPTGEP